METKHEENIGTKKKTIIMRGTTSRTRNPREKYVYKFANKCETLAWKSIILKRNYTGQCYKNTSKQDEMTEETHTHESYH